MVEKEYIVTAPIYGQVTFYVTASNEAEAIEKAKRGEYDDEEFQSWEISERCGRFCHRTEHDRIIVSANE